MTYQVIPSSVDVCPSVQDSDSGRCYVDWVVGQVLIGKIASFPQGSAISLVEIVRYYSDNAKRRPSYVTRSAITRSFAPLGVIGVVVVEGRGVMRYGLLILKIDRRRGVDDRSQVEGSAGEGCKLHVLMGKTIVWIACRISCRELGGLRASCEYSDILHIQRCAARDSQ